MRNLIFIALCIVLVSCGGGGSGNTVPENGSNGGNSSTSTTVTTQPTILAGALNSFESPTFLAVDAANNIYIADARNQAIYKSSADGSLSILAGKAGVAGYVDGQGNSARLHDPYGIAVDSSGNVYVADLGNNAIRKITPAGLVSTLAGTGQMGANDGPGSIATFNHPTGLAIDNHGLIYVSDQGNNAIRKIAIDGSVTTVAISGPQLTSPRGIATDSQGNIYVVDNDALIQKFSPDGTFISLFPTPMSANCIGITISNGGEIYVTCSSGYYRAGKIYKLVSNNWQIVAGTDISGFSNGSALNAQFGELIGVAIDGNNNLYAADNGTASVRKITNTGIVSLLTGSTYASGYADGSGINAKFNLLTSITHDSSNNLYVTDFYNNAIRKITFAGSVSTIKIGSNPPVSSSSLINPTSIASINNCLVISSFNGNDLLGAGYTNFSAINLTANSNSGCPNVDVRETWVPVQYIALNSQGVLYYVETGQVFEDNGAGFYAIAGTSTVYAGGTPVFNQPSGIVADSSGNIYLADMGDSVIYKISKSHTVSIFAGTRLKQGGTDGNGADATFVEPYQLAIDSADNIYVVEKGPVRKITPAGIVSTLNLKWGTPSLHGITVTNGMIYGATTGAILEAPLP